MDELLKNQIFVSHAISAVGSVTLGNYIAYPLDTLKTLVQVGSASGKRLTATQAVNRIQHSTGTLGLYNGFGWSTLGRVSGLGARFGAYEILTAYCKDGREDNHVYLNEAFLSGMGAGALESFFCSPFEIIKLRAQVASASRAPASSFVSQEQGVVPFIAKLLNRNVLDKKALKNSVNLLSTLNNKYPNMTGALKEYPWMMTGSGKAPSVCDVRTASNIISLEGWSALWRGLRAGIVRDSVFGGIFFSSWQFLHEALLDWKAVGMDPVPRCNEEVGPLSPLAVCFSAGLSGIVAAAASHSFDTAKSRSQCTVVPKYVAKERRCLKWIRPGNMYERYTGIHPSDRNVLYRGVFLRMARSGIASFIIVGTYYLTIDHLATR